MICLWFKNEDFSWLSKYLESCKNIRDMEFEQTDPESIFEILDFCKSATQPLNVKISLNESVSFTKKLRINSVIQSIQAQKKFRCTIVNGLYKIEVIKY